MSDNPKTTALDDVSKRIIELLQQDGRRPYAEIGRAVGLSEAAVRQRVQRLTDAGVMQIVAVTDPRQLGFARISGGADADHRHPREVAEAVKAFDEIAYVVVTLGTFDVLAEAICETDEDLLELVSMRVRAIPGVEHTESLIYAGLHKDFYNWGTR